ncbi:hypothetical protein HGRIS_012591 [Hohenbuehelia grisea]|uniref:ABC transporter domain-containing protein n=1 Tax=Hohenbuehelia grisea TaxID=104357 RepID=A0ABR3ISV6_9AGAR
MSRTSSPHVDHATPRSTSAVERLHWGIFELAYERQKPFDSVYERFWRCLKLESNTSSCIRLLFEVLSTAPGTVSAYFAVRLWAAAFPGLSLYLLAIALVLVKEDSPDLLIFGSANNFAHLLIFSWLLSTMMPGIVSRIERKLGLELRGHLRAHFLPFFAEAILNADDVLQQDHHFASTLPQPWSFETVAPGWPILLELFQKAGGVVAVCCQMYALALAIYHTRAPELHALIIFAVSHPFLLHMMPGDGIQGYTFWTNNVHYHRLAALYSIIFSPEYRADIRKDGIMSFLAQDYSQTSKNLPSHRPDAAELLLDIPRSWIWELYACIVGDLPMAILAFILPWNFSLSSMAVMAILHHATSSVRETVSLCLSNPMTFENIFRQAERFYQALDTRILEREHLRDYPDASTSANQGMKITFQNVSLQYDVQSSPATKALDGVSFEIQPGQLVIIVGVNASGKSSMVKLLAGLIDTRDGSILIDDKPIESFKVDQLRSSMTILSQSQVIYPLSLQENLQLGLPWGNRLTKETVQEAARMGMASDILNRLGCDAILNPVPEMGQSMFGVVPPSVLAERDLQLRDTRRLALSKGEEQRLFVARAFVRLMNSDSRLLVVDEALSYLDSVAEHDILSNLLDIQKTDGKTAIFVTHHFGHLATKADRILCMKEGKLFEQGTHEELLAANGYYAELFRNQARLD